MATSVTAEVLAGASGNSFSAPAPRITAAEIVRAYKASHRRPYGPWKFNERGNWCNAIAALYLAKFEKLPDPVEIGGKSYRFHIEQANGGPGIPQLVGEWGRETYGADYYDGFTLGWGEPTVAAGVIDNAWSGAERLPDRYVDGLEDGAKCAFMVAHYFEMRWWNRTPMWNSEAQTFTISEG